MLRKILTPLIISLMVFSSIFISFTPAYADAYFEGRSGNGCGNFLGLTSWDCGVKISNQKSLKSGIWLIATNVLNDIIVIAAYLILGYVIYGGYLYIFSGGDPGKVASGKKTLTHAFIGLAIVMSANLIMNTIRYALIRGSSLSCDLETGAGCADPNTVITNAIQWVIGISGVIAVIFVVYGGIGYITSGGDPSKLQKAKNTILYAVIGLIIVALAEIITAFVSNIIREADKSAFINQTTISKEVHENQIH